MLPEVSVSVGEGECLGSRAEGCQVRCHWVGVMMILSWQVLGMGMPIAVSQRQMNLNPKGQEEDPAQALAEVEASILQMYFSSKFRVSGWAN